MGAFAQLERELIRERTNIGLTAARQRGKEGGRPETHTQDKKETYFEFFHKWHYSQLKDRLKALEKSNFSSLKLGVCKSLLTSKKYDLKDILESENFKKHCFTFRDFPSSKQLFEGL